MTSATLATSGELPDWLVVTGVIALAAILTAHWVWWELSQYERRRDQHND